MSYLKNGVCAAALLALCMPAMAINKCTGPDGKVMFQDAACPNTTKAEEIKSFSSGSGQKEAWQFLKQKDDMTGISTCFALAPSTLVLGVKGVPFVRLQIAMRGDARSVVIRSTSSTDLFHNDISGMGMKIDSNPFIAMDRKVSANVVTFSLDQEAQITQQLLIGKEFKVRVRFWPWDELGDSQAVSLAGFKQAYALTQECAKKI